MGRAGPTWRIWGLSVRIGFRVTFDDEGKEAVG